MTDTPITDSKAIKFHSDDLFDWVKANEMRDMERAITELHKMLNAVFSENRTWNDANNPPDTNRSVEIKTYASYDDKNNIFWGAKRCLPVIGWREIK